VVIVVPTWCGSPDEGEAQIAPFLKLGTLLAGSVRTTSYAGSLSTFNSYIINGQPVFMQTCWMPAIDSISINALIQTMETAVSAGCAIFTHEFRGAASRIPAGATAFGLRRDHVLVEILATLADGGSDLDEQRHRKWTLDALRAFEPVALPGGYPNLLGKHEPDRAQKSYGSNAERLIEAKRRYDPDNVFRSAIPLPIGDGEAQPASGLSIRHSVPFG
jgi:hypothetical protein